MPAVGIRLAEEGRDHRVVHRRQASAGEAIECNGPGRRTERQQDGHVIVDAENLETIAGAYSAAIRRTCSLIDAA